MAARRRDFERARGLWLRALDLAPEEPEIHLALAKHLEHRDRDFVGALEHARRTGEIEDEEGMEHRIARLRRKLDRERSGR